MSVPLEEHVRRFIQRAAATDPFPSGARFGSSEAADHLQRMRSRVRPPRVSDPIDRVLELRTSAGTAVRVYVPASEDPGRVLLVYLHGGGWVSGDLDMHDPTCRSLAIGADAVVVNVDYRLAPEHPYPAPLDDAAEAVAWAIAHAESWGADPARTVVAGTSAGANLAAAVAVRRAEAVVEPALLGQVLIYPVLDAAMQTASHREKADSYFLTADHLRFFWDAYVQSDVDRAHPQISPGLAPDVSQLPPAVVVSAEHDPLRDEADAFAERMRSVGRLLAHSQVPGQIHGFLTAFADSPASTSTLRVVIDGLVRMRTLPTDRAS
ncbi:Carboxylesterase NlhH [Rhodococcus fascians]|uniref:alpha/beta hydrolase n=1 Tax=Rhodococcoides fascians TaxID=1828 RepID=UPI001427A3B0|nr:Carboxylesterase NlhH [Rhodococcus fascians]